MRTHTTPRRAFLGGAIALALLAALPPGRPAVADEEPLKVVATLGHLAAHARVVGGPRVQVDALTVGDQDPHFIQATPSLMNKANAAKVYIELGMDLELWSERVLDGARNMNVRMGFPGHCFAGTGVIALERPAVIARSQGDMHPSGNPHCWTDPLNAVIEARNIAECLGRNDLAHKDEYEKRFQEYRDKIFRAHFGDALVELLGMDALEQLHRKEALFDFLDKKKYKGEALSGKVGGWLGKLWPHRGKKFITFHRDWSYFAKAYGIEVAAQLEPKPGVPPTPGHLSDLEALTKSVKVSGVVCSPYHNVSTAESFAERIGAPFAVVQIDCGALAGCEDYFGLMNHVTDSVVALATKGGAK